MSAAAPSPQPNGVPTPQVPVQVPARSAKETKPKLMQELEVEYWVNQPLEHIERMMARRDPTDRVFFAILRCSLCPPFLSPVALRPRLRSGDFPDWVERLRRRQREKRAFRPGELNDETFDTDKAGKKVPLSLADLAALTGLAKPHLYPALRELRESGLLEDRKGEFRIAPPKAAPPPVESDPAGTCTGTDEIESLLRKLSNALGRKVTCTGTSDEEQERAVQVLLEASTVFKEGLQKLRTEVRERLEKAGTGNCILIKEKGRSNKETAPTPADRTPPASDRVQPSGKREQFERGSSSSAREKRTTPTPHPVDKEEKPPEAPPEDHAKVADFIRPHTFPSPYAVRKLVHLCRQTDPRVTAEEIVRLLEIKLPDAKKARNFMAFLWKAVPEMLQHGGLDEIRAAPPPTEAPHGALSLRDQYYELLAQWEALPEKHANRPVFERRLDELRAELRAESEAEKGRRR